ncbi:MAG: hypothetical protein ABIH03_10570 [Pseudomonadota bacterium]
MQFQHLATAPECLGLAGVMVYKSRYADEENVRWAGRLFRHYCIEGNTELLSRRYGYEYALKHIMNPDFDDGLEGWTIKAARQGSVEARAVQGLGRMQGRVAAGVGNNALWTKRCENRPNMITQEIKGLVPGQMYSVKAIAADFGAWKVGKSDNEKIVTSVRVDGAEVDEKKSFSIANHGFVKLGAFIKTNGVPYHKYHWLVFRAKGASALLTLSDWETDAQPGGPIGQEIVWNFVEVQPYFD